MRNQIVINYGLLKFSYLIVIFLYIIKTQLFNIYLGKIENDKSNNLNEI